MNELEKFKIQKSLKYAHCISKLEDVCDLAYAQDSDEFAKQYNEIVNTVWELGDDQIRTILKEIMKSVDIIFIADQVKLNILPRLRKLIPSDVDVDVPSNQPYRIVPTESGYFTLYETVHNRYIHSVTSPMNIARNNIKAVYKPKYNHYLLWGIGLGYELLCLYEISNGSIKIDAYENDPFVFECAKNYGVLDKIPEGVVNYHVGNDISGFVNDARGIKKGIYINLPSFWVLDNVPEREALMDILIKQCTLVRLENQFAINLFRNMEKKLPLVDSFVPGNNEREIVVVAAGPSLDDAMDFLKKKCKDKCILAVGTVYKKLLQNGIVPNAVFVNDPKERTTNQFTDIWDEKVPLIIDAVAHWKFAEKYKGDKYIVWTGLANEICNVSKELSNNKIYPSSRTVTGFAIDYAISKHPEIIYFVGVDLAYPAGKSHASGTMDCHQADTSNMWEIPANRGGVVYTDALFNSYRLEIEEKISMNPNILFINKSDIGAKIQGTE